MLVGIVAILIGLLLPALSQARETTLETKCLLEMRDNMVVLHLYAGENQDFWPMGFERGSGVWTGLGGMEFADEEYLSVSGYWSYVLRDSYNNDSLHPSLICPVDRDTADLVADVGEKMEREPSQVVFALDRVMSASMYVRPSWCREDQDRWDMAAGTVGKVSLVRYPSSKAGLYEIMPFHDERMVTVYEPVPNPPYPLSVVAVDSSAASRRTDDAIPPVLIDGPYVGEVADTRRAMGTFGLTRDGWLGRDW